MAAAPFYLIEAAVEAAGGKEREGRWGGGAGGGDPGGGDPGCGVSERVWGRGESPPAAAPAPPAGRPLGSCLFKPPPPPPSSSPSSSSSPAPPSARREQWSEPLTQPSPPGLEWDRPTGKGR